MEKILQIFFFFFLPFRQKVSLSVSCAFRPSFHLRLKRFTI
jgi:hypothetical protein